MPVSLHRFHHAGSDVRYELTYSRTDDAASYRARVWKEGTYLAQFGETMHRQFVTSDRWTDATVELLAMCRVEARLRSLIQGGV